MKILRIGVFVVLIAGVWLAFPGCSDEDVLSDITVSYTVIDRESREPLEGVFMRLIVKNDVAAVLVNDYSDANGKAFFTYGPYSSPAGMRASKTGYENYIEDIPPPSTISMVPSGGP